MKIYSSPITKENHVCTATSVELITNNIKNFSEYKMFSYVA